MKLLSNGRESFRTGDAIAAAVLAYALALSRDWDAASVTIPTASGPNEVNPLTILIGYGVPLSVVDLDGSDDLVDEACVDEIRRVTTDGFSQGDARPPAGVLLAFDSGDR